ncbi:MAG: two-component system LytT family response regulator [Crocinitomix sp.]|jgi:two-component system LytT family response regulator
MSKISAILVDDEKRARNVLFNLLEHNCEEIDVVAECSNVPDAVEQINLLNPDVVFLDVQMPNYAGYEIVKFFNEINFEIIFVTAYDHYAIKAFELSAIDYLIKPINRLRLTEAVQKLSSKITERNKLVDYSVLLSSMREKEFKQIVIPELGDRRVLELNTIVAIEADGSYSKVHLINGQVVTVSKTLKHFETVLPEAVNFFRSHRAWIINTKHLKQFNKTKRIAILECDINAKISRNKVVDFQRFVS